MKIHNSMQLDKVKTNKHNNTSGGGVAQWLGRRFVAGELSLIYA